MGLKKCIGYVDEKNIKARMTNKFSGYKEVKRVRQINIKTNKNITGIKLEIVKKDWLKNTKKLCLLYPNLYRI